MEVELSYEKDYHSKCEFTIKDLTTKKLSIMKNFTSFFQLFALVVFSFANSNSFAQITALGSALTPNLYTASEIAGFGNNTIVLLKKPDVTNGYRLASYGVSPSGGVELKDTEDFTSWAMPVITKLSATRMVMVTNGNEHTRARIYDINANGDLTPKGLTDVAPMVSWSAKSIIRLNNSAFMVDYSVDGKVRLYTLFVNASGSTVTVKDEDQYTVTGLQGIELARMSDTRIIAAALSSTTNSMKVICYDINASTGNIVRKGDYYWSWTTKRVTMTAFGENKLACFTSDLSDRLDVVTFEISAAGSFTQKYTYHDMLIPGTSSYFYFKSIDSQNDSGVNKIHLCAVRTTNKLNIIPFTFSSNGSLTIEPSGHYLSPTNYTATSASTAGGFVVASSLLSNGNARIQAFKWGN